MARPALAAALATGLAAMLALAAAAGLAAATARAVACLLRAVAARAAAGPPPGRPGEGVEDLGLDLGRSGVGCLRLRLGVCGRVGLGLSWVDTMVCSLLPMRCC
ncbi:hypothetical protein BV379_16410 [Rhodovulum sulfidophilum]|nr:hypothetical protein BV379_16410 [Rhodovulum sulfidophilum]